MTATICLECRGSLPPGASKCRCGAAVPAAAQAQADRSFVKCDRCPNAARNRVGDRNLCLTCQDDIRHEEARKFCEQHGLKTVDEMREFCRVQARTFGRPSFETWAANMKQKTVDLIAIMDGPESKTLDRLKDAGVIDGRNKIIPAGEAREIAKQARRAERARVICELQAKALVQSSLDDDQAAAA